MCSPKPLPCLRMNGRRPGSPRSTLPYHYPKNSRLLKAMFLEFVFSVHVAGSESWAIGATTTVSQREPTPLQPRVWSQIYKKIAADTDSPSVPPSRKMSFLCAIVAHWTSSWSSWWHPILGCHYSLASERMFGNNIDPSCACFIAHQNRVRQSTRTISRTCPFSNTRHAGDHRNFATSFCISSLLLYNCLIMLCEYLMTNRSIIFV